MIGVIPNPPPPRSPRYCSAAKAGISLSAITILVVDDDADVREVVCAMLLSLGYRVFTAPDGGEALRIASAKGGPKIDVLLTDYRMPEMRGDELAKRFHAASPMTGMIIMSSESPALPRVPHCGFLAKPFHLEALSAKVRAVTSIEGSA